MQQFHVFVLIVYLIKELSSAVPNGNIRNNAVARLKKDLFCNYDPAGRPRKNATGFTDVSVRLWPKHIDYFQVWPLNTDEIRIHGWLVWEWNDEFLQWNPEKYSGIDYLLLNSHNIWTPYFFHFTTSDEMSVTSDLLGAKCTILSTGAVNCPVPSTYQALCDADLSTWPMDTHTCKLHFALLHTEYYNVRVTQSNFSLLEYEPNREWELLSIKSPQAGNNLLYLIELRRHAAAYAAAVSAPAIVLSVFTLLLFWIDPQSSSRIYLCCMNIFAYFLYMQYLSYSLPNSGDTCPKVVFFYRDSLLLAVFALVISVILRNISSLATIPPYWCIYSSNFLRDTMIGQIVMFPHLTSKETTINEESGEEVLLPVVTSEWKLIMHLADRFLFYLYLVIFLSLFLVFVI